MRWLLFSTVLITLAIDVMAFEPSHAKARRGWALIGSSENIAEVADVVTPEALTEVGFAQPVIGYKYSDFSVFFVPLFTGGGSYVVCDRDGDSYIPLDDAQVLALSGQTPDDIGTPFFYKVPFGWLILGPFLALQALAFVQRWRAVGA